MEISEQKLRNILSEQREEYQAYLGVLKKDFESQVKLIAEQYGFIAETLSSNAKTLNAQTKMIGKSALDMEIVKTDIAFIKGGLKKKVDYEEFEVLVNRVAILETKR